MKYDKIYHLSHNDLDGYGCQFMTRFLKSEKTEILFFNTSYEDVISNINKIFSTIVISYDKNKPEKILFLLTDFSINSEIESKLKNFQKGNKHIKLDFQVLDHHKTGEEISLRNDWYKYDITKCGASMTADFVCEKIKNKNIKETLQSVGQIIQAHDLWEEQSKYFGISNVLADVIQNFYFLEEFEFEKREFISNYIFVFCDFVLKNKNITVEYLEENLPLILRKTLSLFIEDKNIIQDSNIRSIYKLFYYQSEIFHKRKDIFPSITLNEFNCIVFYNLNSSFFQYFSHYVLEKDKGIDFLINVKANKNCSLRSVKENVDVSKIAEKIAPGKGGGHFHAAGCKINTNIEFHSAKEVANTLKLVCQKGN